MEVRVLLRELHAELLRGSHLPVGGDLDGVAIRPRVEEELAEHPVEGLAVVLLEVVRAGIVVDVRAERVLRAEESEDRPRGVEQRRQRRARPRSSSRPWRCR